MQPLISIITPNYNCAKYIAIAIESVQNQSYQNWEMLIQDDCSIDNSFEIAKSYEICDSRIKVEVNAKNSGAAITRNNAIERSKGEYLAFLDSDDLWLPNKLELQLKFMIENICDFSCTRCEQIDENGVLMGLQAKVVKKMSYNKLLFHFWPQCLTVMYKQDVNNKIFCEDINKSNDQALFLSVIKKCTNPMGFDECLALYRIRENSMSRKKIESLKPYIKVIHEFEGKSILLAYFSVFTHLLVKYLFKYKKQTIGSYE